MGTVTEEVTLEALLTKLQMQQETLDAFANKVDAIADLVEELHSTFKRFEPVLKRYEQASQANGLLAQRRAMKGKGQ